MTNADIVGHVNRAIKLLTLEKRPLQPDASERSFAHRLAVHMEPLFPGWDIDCEYNRFGMLTKELEGIKGCDEQKRTDRIYPDIIVHERTNESCIQRNLLVVEIKKRNTCDACDKKKLELLTAESGTFKYQVGLYVNIEEKEIKRTWYKGGSEVDESVLIAA
jgi:hypothetical protein